MMTMMTLHEPATAGLSLSRAPVATVPVAAAAAPRPSRRRRKQVAIAGVPNSGAQVLQANSQTSADGTAGRAPHQQQEAWRQSPQQPIMLGQPSSNLQDMCSLQLGLLQLLLQKSSNTPHHLRAAVYVRAIGRDSAAGTVCLRRVAATSASTARQYQTGQQEGWSVSNGGGSGSLHASGDVIMLQLAEECLVNEEMLLLPNSGSLVLPLVEIARGTRTLVGMLLVEPSRTLQDMPVTPQPQHSSSTSQSSDEVAECSANSLDAIDSNHHAHAQPSARTTQQQQQLVPFAQQLADSLGNEMAHSSSTLTPEGCCGTLSMPLADGHFITPEPHLTGWPSWVGTYPGFTDDELLALRATAPVLAKACAMELANAAATLQGAAANTRAAVAASIVQQARKPMAAVNSMSAMLLPRMEEGTPDRDFVRNIRVQGERLQELLRQLDAALAPRAPPLAAPGHSYPVPLTSQPSAAQPWPALNASLANKEHAPPPHSRNTSLASQQLAPQPAAAAAAAAAGAVTQVQASAAWRAGSHRRIKMYADLEIAGQTAAQFAGQDTSGNAAAPLGIPTQQLAVDALPAAAARNVGSVHGMHHRAGDGTEATLPMLQANGQEGQQQQQQQQAEVYQHGRPQTGPQAPAQTPVQQEAPATAESAAHHSDKMPEPERAFTMRFSPADIAADGVIDLEAVDVLPAPQPGSSKRAVQFSTSGDVTPPSGRRARVWHASAPQPRVNVVTALINVLTAGARLAKASGVYFAVHHPLQTAQPSDNSTAGLSVTASSASHHSPFHIVAQGTWPIDNRSQPGAAVRTGVQVALKPAVPALQPRPSRPLYVTVRAGIIARIIAYVVDLALQCTPRGGIVGVSASQFNSWVELVVSHTGQLVVQRFHPRSTALHAPSNHKKDGSHHQAQQHASGHVQTKAVAASSSSATATAADKPSHAEVMQPAAHPAASQAAAGEVPRATVLPGSGLLSFGMAEELVAAVGGTITSQYPVHMHHAVTGHMEIATRVVIRLPAAAQ